MNSSELGIGLICMLTFLGIVPWLLSASWKTSRVQSAMIVFCASSQLIVAMLALYFANFGLLSFSAVMAILYIWAGYVGAERFGKGTRNV